MSLTRSTPFGWLTENYDHSGPAGLGWIYETQSNTIPTPTINISAPTIIVGGNVIRVDIWLTAIKLTNSSAILSIDSASTAVPGNDFEFDRTADYINKFYLDIDCIIETTNIITISSGSLLKSVYIKTSDLHPPFSNQSVNLFFKISSADSDVGYGSTSTSIMYPGYISDKSLIPSEFRITNNIINHTPPKISACWADGIENNVFRMQSANSSYKIRRDLYIATSGTTANSIEASIDPNDSYREGQLNGATVEVYRIVSGAFTHIRSGTVSNHRNSGWRSQIKSTEAIPKTVHTWNYTLDSWNKPSTDYWFSVVAIDSNGDISQPSNVVKISFGITIGTAVTNPSKSTGLTFTASDGISPVAPTNFSASLNPDGTVSMSWDSNNVESNLVGYRIWRSDYDPAYHYGYRLELSDGGAPVQADDMVFVSKKFTTSELSNFDLLSKRLWKDGPSNKKYIIPCTSFTKNNDPTISVSTIPWADADSTVTEIKDGDGYFRVSTITPFTKTVNCTAGSNVITCSDTSGLSVGMYIGNLPGNNSSYILSINPNVSITLENNCSTTISSRVINIGRTSVAVWDTYAHAGIRSGFYETLRLEPITLEFWAKSNITGQITFSVGGISLPPGRIFTTNTTWTHYSYTFTPNILLQGDTPQQISLTLDTTTTARVYDIAFVKLYYSSNGQTYGTWANDDLTNIVNSKPHMIRTHGIVKTGIFTYDLDHLTRYRGNSYQYTLEPILSNIKLAQSNPWLQLEMHLSPNEWLGVIEYLCASYDPLVDTQSSKPWAYRRYMQGHQIPWISQFNEMYIELSNETWNSTYMAPWVYRNIGPYDRSEVYGMFQEYIINVIKSSPYWTTEINNKVKFVIGGWANGDYGYRAAVKSPSSSVLTIADYNGGWDSGAVIPTLSRSGLHSILTASGTKIKGAHDRLKGYIDLLPGYIGATYEAGPGYQYAGLNGVTIGSVYRPALISNITWNSGIATINTITNHSGIPTQIISITDTINSSFNGEFEIYQVLSPTQFTIKMINDPGPWSAGSPLSISSITVSDHLVYTITTTVNHNLQLNSRFTITGATTAVANQAYKVVSILSPTQVSAEAIGSGSTITVGSAVMNTQITFLDNEIREQERAMKSLCSGVGTIDCFLDVLKYGFKDNTYFTFSRGENWTSHLRREFGGQATPAWKLIELFNNIAISGDMIETINYSVSRFDEQTYIDVPYISTYSFKYNNKYYVAVINKKIPYYPNVSDDGYNQILLYLPFYNVNQITLYKMTGNEFSENTTADNVHITTENIDKKYYANKFRIDQFRGGNIYGMPPNSVFLYEFDGKLDLRSKGSRFAFSKRILDI